MQQQHVEGPRVAKRLAVPAAADENAMENNKSATRLLIR